MLLRLTARGLVLAKTRLKADIPTQLISYSYHLTACNSAYPTSTRLNAANRLKSRKSVDGLGD